MNHSAALYARVSSDQQKENHTIASQTAALHEYAQAHGYTVPPEFYEKLLQVMAASTKLRSPTQAARRIKDDVSRFTA